MFQDSSGFSPTERKLLGDFLSAQLQVRRSKQGRAGDKSLAAVLAEFRFDLRPHAVGSSGGGAGTEAPISRARRKGYYAAAAALDV